MQLVRNYTVYRMAPNFHSRKFSHLRNYMIITHTKIKFMKIFVLSVDIFGTKHKVSLVHEYCSPSPNTGMQLS